MHNLKVLAFKGGMNHLNSRSVAGQSARFTGSCSSPSVKLLKFWQNPDKASDASWLIEQLWSPPAPRPEKVPFCEKRPILWRRVSCADWRRRESFVTFVRPHFPKDCHRPLIQLSPPPNRSLAWHKSWLKFFSNWDNAESQYQNTGKDLRPKTESQWFFCVSSHQTNLGLERV